VKAGCVDQNITSDQAATTYSCSATSAGGTAPQVDVSIKRDATSPLLSGMPTKAADGNNGWYMSNVTIHWTCSDATSGISGSCPSDIVISSEGTGLTANASVNDGAGNSTSTSSAPAVKIDKSAPNVTLAGGPANGTSYAFGSVPAAPTCNASDAVSGLSGTCSVSGYSNAVGSHTVIATATDNAGNIGTASATYTVVGWTLKGFYQPTDMSGVWNSVKNGSTVPLKFEIFAGSTELTDVSAVKSVTQAIVACSAGTEDAIEEVVSTTGGTVLRYDSSGIGQFIDNWKTPAQAGKCYRVTLTAQDGSSLSSLFKQKYGCAAL
jgi:hypothetical protein